MHIISGIYKNSKILTPDDSKTHPMGSREKLALFNMLSSYLPSSVVLDAFSGSGALGLESLSRGASRVVFVEKSPKIAKIIQKNLENLVKNDQTPLKRSEIIIKDINKVDFPEEKFDIILADPPYNDFKIEEIKNLVKFLKTGGILALSSPKNSQETLVSTSLEKLTEKTYAAAKISLFKKV